MNHLLFNQLLILLVVSLTVTALFQRLKIPVIIGYILVGFVVGPFALGLIPASQTTQLLAEFGIVFLMFTIGLEFSIPHLIQLKKDVFGFGGLQVLLTFLATLVVGKMLAIGKIELMIIGAIVAMSSTAIVLKQFTQQLEINAPENQHAIGILLFQDLMVIPVLIVLPSLAAVQSSGLGWVLVISLMKSVLAIGLILALGKWILRPIFYAITRFHSLELFTLTTLFIALGFAWLTAQLGLSMTLGAFLAGITLGETEFRHQIKKDIRPFLDVLLGFFFITIGMQFNPGILSYAWPWMLLLVCTLIFFKIVIISLLGLYFTRNPQTALKTGLTLAQGGEFGFAILLSALSFELVPQDNAQVILGALLISMIFAPLLIQYRIPLADGLLRLVNKRVITPTPAALIHTDFDLNNHIILCGYGRVGQNIARFLDKAQLRYLALDLDPTRVKNARLAGENVFYADAGDYEVLRSASIHQAKALIVSFVNPQASCQLIHHVRHHHQKLPIIVRSHDENETEQYYDSGATEVIPEILEGALMIAAHILLLMKIPPHRVDQWVNESRHDRYDLLRMVFPGKESLTLEENPPFEEELMSIRLPKEAFAIGKSIKNLDLTVKITAIRRGNHRHINPPADFEFMADDVAVLYGTPAMLESAEKKLMLG